MTCPDGPRTAQLHAFSCFTHAHGAFEHDVYVVGQPADPPVLVMHELPGLTDETLNFARRLQSAQFRVYLPHLFGRLRHDDPQGNHRRLCISEEIDRLRREFPGRVDAHEYDGPSRWPMPPHAVLTYEYERAGDAGPDHPTRRAFATLVAFLRERLGTTGGPHG